MGVCCGQRANILEAAGTCAYRAGDGLEVTLAVQAQFWCEAFRALVYITSTSTFELRAARLSCSTASEPVFHLSVPRCFAFAHPPFHLLQRAQMLGSVNLRNQTPLMIAVQTGKDEIVQTVVDFIGDEVRVSRRQYSR